MILHQNFTLCNDFIVVLSDSIYDFSADDKILTKHEICNMHKEKNFLSAVLYSKLKACVRYFLPIFYFSTKW